MDQLVREFVLQMYVWPFVCSKTHIVACFMYRVMKIKMQWHIMNPEQKCIYSQFSSTGIAIFVETLCSLCFCSFSHVCFSNNATCNAFCNAHVVLWNTAFELSTEVILEVASSKGKSLEPGEKHMASHSYRNHYPWRIHGTGLVYLPTFSHKSTIHVGEFIHSSHASYGILLICNYVPRRIAWASYSPLVPQGYPPQPTRALTDEVLVVHLSNEKWAPGCFGYRANYTAQLSGDYKKPV